MRIGSLWIREKDGQRTTGGVIRSDSGINLPAGAELSCRIVKNDQKEPGSNHPDAYIEAWSPRERKADESGASSGDPIPF